MEISASGVKGLPREANRQVTVVGLLTSPVGVDLELLCLNSCACP
jgi:hypothetical protein